MAGTTLVDYLTMHVPHFVNEFIETWQLWWRADKPLTDHLLWGHPIFIRARWGKVSEIVGASIALYEIWAPSAAKIAEDAAPETLWHAYKEAPAQVREQFPSGGRKLYLAFAAYICLCLLIASVASRYSSAPGLVTTLALFVEVYLGSMIPFLVVILIWIGIGILARPVAWIGVRKNAVIVVGFAFICLGLVFDLLGT